VYRKWKKAKTLKKKKKNRGPFDPRLEDVGARNENPGRGPKNVTEDPPEQREDVPSI